MREIESVKNEEIKQLEEKIKRVKEVVDETEDSLNKAEKVAKEEMLRRMSLEKEVEKLTKEVTTLNGVKTMIESMGVKLASNEVKE